MQERRLGNSNNDNLVKVYVNEYDDYIVLDRSDTSFTQKFALFIEWLENKQKELDAKGRELDKKYEGKPIVENGEDGEVKVDTEQFMILSEMRVGLFRECVERIDAIFGKDTIRKYFRQVYEYVPDYIPDDTAISDFLDEITPVLEEIFKEKMKKMNSKYNKNRKGKHSKIKEELLEEAKARQLKKAADPDE